MRVAVLSYGLPTPGEKRGGIERVAHMLAQGLAERGHQVIVYSHDAQPKLAAYQVRELPWKRFVNTWMGRRLTMGYLGNIAVLRPDYSEFNVIIAHGDSLLLPVKGKPIVRVMHGSALGEALHATSPGRFVLQMGIYMQELATALLEHGTVAVSENTHKHNPFARHIIPNGVDGRVFNPLPAAKSPAPSIVFVGAMSGRKRGQFLLDLFSRRVRAVRPDAELIFVGHAGPALPGVTYHVGITDEQLAALYRQAWVYASPSTYEGFGLPYLEAMACGTAVVATPNPGSQEVLADGRFGRLVSDDKFGSAILELFTDADARGALESSGIQRARAFSLNAMIDRYEALMEGLRAAHAGSVASV